MAKETKYEAVILIWHNTKNKYVHPGEVEGFTPVAAKKLLAMGAIKPIEKQSVSEKEELKHGTDNS